MILIKNNYTKNSFIFQSWLWLEVVYICIDYIYFLIPTMGLTPALTKQAENFMPAVDRVRQDLRGGIKNRYFLFKPK